VKTLFGFYNFPEKWSELNPRFAFADGEVNLNIQLFTELDESRASVVNSDCQPQQVATFMVKVAVALSYCGVMAARIGGHLNQAQENMDKLKARKVSALTSDPDPTKRPKSDAALERVLASDIETIDLKWAIEDLKVMHQFCGDTFRTLQKDAENWRARYYGAQTDRKLTPGINEPWSPEAEPGLPPRIGGGV
jgi:hypothetical protein